ncbi:MAG: peptidylprolyl isomerase, partial [Odoribacter sp.]|nr:peptidylprolyl isomerase [Odoribacter sp.]
DKIIAVVGEEIILKSDIEKNYINQQLQGLVSSSSDYRTNILENFLVQKLLIAQAKLDSISVSEDEVEAEVSRQINFYANTLGSVERVESYFDKNIEDIRNDLRSNLRDELTTQNMQSKIMENIRTTPSEVKALFRKIPKDSLPDMPDKYELQQIVLKPQVSEAEKERIRELLRGFREQIQNEETSFTTLAVLHSQDGAASKGGELGYMSKTELVPKFADVAFNLKPGRVSKIVETEYGFHIMKLNDRQGEKLNVRHIVLQPKVSAQEREEALQALDTIRQAILTDDDFTFEKAAYFYSTDKKTRNNGGLMASEEDIDSKIERALVPGEIARQIANLKVGEITQPFVDRTEYGEEYKIVKVKAFYPQHKANLEEDWMIFENMLKNEKQRERFNKWLKEKQQETYIRIDDEYKNANFNFQGWIK